MRRRLFASLALAAAGSGAAAQGLPEPLLSAAITQSFVADTNFNLSNRDPGTSYYGDTRLVLGLLNETPTQTLTLGLDTGLRALWQAEEDFELTFASPSTARVGYIQDWSSGTADTYLRYRQRDVDSTSLEFIDEDIDGAIDDIREIDQNGTERRYDGGFDLEVATDSPSSYEFNFVGTRFDYSGDSEDRTPRTTLAGDALWILELNPVVSGTVGAGYSYYDADNPQQTEIRQGDIDFGVIYDRSEILQLRFGVGYATYTREQLVQGTRETINDDNGYVVRGGLRYAFEEVTVEANLRLSDAAPETRLSGDVRAVYPLPRGSITGRVFQRYGGGDTGEEIRVSGAAIGLQREINTVSQLGFNVSAARQENLDTDEADTDRLNFTATYSRNLTEVVSANVGYRFRSRDQDPESADSNAVFFEIARSFETRP